ncbi:ATP synthase F1, gamma subunit [Mycoplasmopsis californica]|uniref:ATP synthase gamma chain n=1 Tax=Mycoplasmopsis equigenitalium TaxID=114883 RepID=A0ABY5J208_9BACT|nr:ATP synthase F1 subunit gamma [Mycoplasmopsis equigenitalium]UUD37289.1 ATP synthase F1 subunit gamma [Mycoplasmopsis equigenitalium]VEU69401.1 ATP synthase F1, gamma subunit [Mycoplasmopsis californica]
MANLQKTRERIRTVNNIKIITNAMQHVATSKMSKILTHYKRHEKYHSLFMHMFDDIRARLSEKEIANLFKDNNADAKLYIIVTSDMGLNGSYNSNIFKLAKKTIKPNDLLYVFGSKGCSYFSDDQFKNKIVHKEIDTGDLIDFSLANKAARIATYLYKNNKINEIHIIYTQFVNNIVYNENVIKIFPFEKIKSEQTGPQQLIDFEPNEQEVLAYAIPMYLASQIYEKLITSKLSETSSRRFAMENATKNANELIDNLKLEYNRVRQAKITQEIAEIISGT